MEQPLYIPFVSRLSHKKYSVYVLNHGRRKLIHFGGDPRQYGHYFDVLGHYADLNHLDTRRRDSYYARHGHTDNVNTARYWSNRVLWPEDH